MKLSIETLMEEVQSVVLETAELESGEESKILELSVNQVSAQSNYNLCFSSGDCYKLNLAGSQLDEEMQPVASENKLILIWRRIIHTILALQAHWTIEEAMLRKKMDFESSSKKINWLAETLKEQVLT